MDDIFSAAADEVSTLHRCALCRWSWFIVFRLHGGEEENLLKWITSVYMSFHQSRLNRDQRSQIYYWPIKYTSRSYLDIVGVCEEHGETINTHAPSCCGWKAILQRSAEGLIDEHRLIVTFCLGLWKQWEHLFNTTATTQVVSKTKNNICKMFIVILISVPVDWQQIPKQTIPRKYEVLKTTKNLSVECNTNIQAIAGAATIKYPHQDVLRKRDIS